MLCGLSSFFLLLNLVVMATGNHEVQVTVISFHKTCDVNQAPQICGCCEENNSSCLISSCSYNLTLTNDQDPISEGRTLNCTRAISTNFTCIPDAITFNAPQLPVNGIRIDELTEEADDVFFINITNMMSCSEVFSVSGMNSSSEITVATFMVKVTTCDSTTYPTNTTSSNTTTQDPNPRAVNTTVVVVVCIVALVALLLTISAIVIITALIRRQKRRMFGIGNSSGISRNNKILLENGPDINIDDCQDQEERSRPRDHLNLQLGDNDPSSDAKINFQHVETAIDSKSGPQITILPRGVNLLSSPGSPYTPHKERLDTPLAERSRKLGTPTPTHSQNSSYESLNVADLQRNVMNASRTKPPEEVPETTHTDDPPSPPNENADKDGYDYEIPYWVPADKKVNLLSQFEKLRIRVISGKRLERTNQLGQGAFGRVYRGLWCHHSGDKEVVAIKTLEEEVNEKDRVKFLQEAAIMGQFNHPNIVKIKGIVVKEQESQIIMELMSNGNLREYLPKLKEKLTDQCELASQLLYYSRQIAGGMAYMMLKGYIHRDLAARNVLVSEDDICKIGDFGLSRDLNCEEFYMSHGGKVPVKWTAPEALQYRLYSHASEVWSYGCVLYEIWSLGIKPFNDLSNVDVMHKVARGYRLPPPPGCPRIIYNLMIRCWNKEPESRPRFCYICSHLNLPDIKTLKWSTDDAAAFSDTSRTLGSPLDEGEGLFPELQKVYLKE